MWRRNISPRGKILRYPLTAGLVGPKADLNPEKKRALLL
jgi:hypothetical protein